MIPHLSRTWGCLCAALLFFFALEARAALLDWDSLAWTPGSLTQSFDIDASNPGDDVMITITGDTGQFTTGYPTTAQSLTGGLSPAEYSLHLDLDFSRNTQAITVNVVFLYAQGVQNATTSLFNIDSSGTTYIDQIRTIQATDLQGNAVAATLTGSANNRVTGSDLNQVVTGTSSTAATSGDGNASIDFGANTVTDFQFAFGSDSAARRNPSAQQISFHDISFTPVPEMGTVWGVLVVSVLAIIAVTRQNLRRLKTLPKN